MPTQTFKMITEVQTITRRDFTVADRDLLVPSNSNPLTMGEWLQLDANYEVIRGDGTVPAFAMFVETGRSDIQAIGKVTTLFLGAYEAETLIFNSGAAPALGAALEVATVTYDSKSKSGLQTQATGLTVGYVTRTAASNGGYLRFIQIQG